MDELKTVAVEVGDVGGVVPGRNRCDLLRRRVFAERCAVLRQCSLADGQTEKKDATLQVDRAVHTARQESRLFLCGA